MVIPLSSTDYCFRATSQSYERGARKEDVELYNYYQITSMTVFLNY